MKTALTIGNVDGVHRGHRALIEALLNWRRQQETPATIKTTVVTFSPHPVEVLRPGITVPRLTSPAEKQNLILQSGVDELAVLDFTAAFSQMSAEEFFETVLIQRFDPAFIAIGHNFYFGRQKQGTPELLIEWCKLRNIRASIIEPVEADGAPISSSRIRKLLQDGQMNAASRLLGRDYSISGEVIHGNKKGREIGFPTANVLPATAGLEVRCLPANGVYLSAATVEGKTFASITNVGRKPTVEINGPVLIETHILDYSGDLYGKQLTVEFRDRIRLEQKFNGLAELKLQIQKDTAFARSQLRHN